MRCIFYGLTIPCTMSIQEGLEVRCGICTALHILVLNSGVNVSDKEARMGSGIDDDLVEGSLGFIRDNLLGVSPDVSSSDSGYDSRHFR
jgi:hypothetical protein